MKRMIFYLALACLFGCKTPCMDKDSLSAKTGRFLAVKWECKNVTKMQSDLDSWFAEHNLCSITEDMKKTRGLLSSAVCGILIEKVRSSLATSVPPAWECNSALVGKDAASAFAGLCSLIPF